MEKTKEELDSLKKEYESLTAELKKLSSEELMKVAGGKVTFIDSDDYTEEETYEK